MPKKEQGGLEAPGSRFLGVYSRLSGLLDDRKVAVLLLLYSAVAFFVSVQPGFVLFADTNGYISGSIIRPPFYPLLLELFRYLFGASEFTALVFAQTAAIMAAALYLSRVLRTIFSLDNIFLAVIYFFLTLPLLPISVAAGIHGGIGRYILTEAPTYALFLLTLAFLARSLALGRLRDFLPLFALSALNTLVRTQLAFMYPVVLALLWYTYARSRDLGRVLRLAALAAACFFAADLSERFYHRAVNGYFGKVSFSATHMLVGAVYVSDAESLKFISDEKARLILGRTYAFLEAKKGLAKNRAEVDKRLVDLYEENFVAILVPGLMRSFGEVYPGKEMSDEFMIRMEDFSRKVLPGLALHYSPGLAKLYLLKFLYSLGFREGFFLAVVFLAPFLPLPRNVVVWLRFTALMLLINRGLMTPVIYLGDRYLFYTDLMEYVALAVCAGAWLRSVPYLRQASGPVIDEKQTSKM